MALNQTIDRTDFNREVEGHYMLKANYFMLQCSIIDQDKMSEIALSLQQ